MMWFLRLLLKEYHRNCMRIIKIHPARGQHDIIRPRRHRGDEEEVEKRQTGEDEVSHGLFL